MSVITDATLGKIVEQVERKNNVLMKFINMYATTSWQEVLANVRAGRAKDNYVIGDELVCEYNYQGTKYEFPWMVVDIDREFELADGTTANGLVLQAEFATIESIPFDAEERVEATEATAVDGWYYCGVSGSTWNMLNLNAGDTVPYSEYDHIYKGDVNHTDPYRYGYNRWSMSAYRQWLNSSAAAGQWWTSQHDGDTAPTSALNSYAGFMAGLDSDFLSVVQPVKIHTACNTVTDGGVTDTTCDKFWLPSIEEMYGVAQAPGVEGDYFPLWKTLTGLDSPSNDNNAGRIVKPVENRSGNAQHVRLRSAYRGYGYYAWTVYTAGQLYYYIANSAYRSAPACVIC